MRFARIALFLFLVGFGASVETAWTVRHKIPGGVFSWQLFRGRFDGPSHSFDRPAEVVALPEGTRLELANEHGAVRVAAGEPGEARAVLRVVVYEANAERARAIADRVKLRAEVAGGTLVVGTNRDEWDRGDVGIETHVEITVPPGTPARISNEHGATSVADTGPLELDARFETVDVQRVQGDARIDVEHADVAVADVTGGVQLGNRHGDTRVERLGAPLRAEIEHGDVELRDVPSSDVKLRHGRLSAERIAGNLVVEGEHAGVTATAVNGSATVRTRFRDVELSEIRDAADVTAEHGVITLRRVGGTARAHTRFDDVSLDTIGGAVDVAVESGGVEARGLAQGGVIRASGDPVRVDGFAGALEVRGERADIELSTTTLDGPITATTSHADIELRLPAGAPMALEIEAPLEDVDAEVPGLQTSVKEPERLAGQVGEGGPRVHLAAERGHVRVITGLADER